jgi:hypothetical protein
MLRRSKWLALAKEHVVPTTTKVKRGIGKEASPWLGLTIFF